MASAQIGRKSFEPVLEPVASKTHQTWAKSIRAGFGSAFILAILAVHKSAVADDHVSFVQRDSNLSIRIDGKPFAEYVWNDRNIVRPYFTNIHAPNGIQVTRNNPPIEGKDAIDHATMHPGLWLAFGDLSGADFWRNKGVVKHIEFVEKPSANAIAGRFAVKNLYLADNEAICTEVCRIRILLMSSGYWIIWDSQFAGAGDFYFGDQEEMGLGVRVATFMTVKNGGEIVNGDGLRNEAQVWGKQSECCDYSGSIDGQQAGVLLMADSMNFRRAWFHARDYGLLVANPFGVNAFTTGPMSKVVVRKGESLRIRFGVLVHAKPVDLKAAPKEWLTLSEVKD